MIPSRKISFSLFLAVLGMASFGFRPFPALAREEASKVSHAQKAVPHPQAAPVLLGRTPGKETPVIDAHSAVANTDLMPVAAGVTVITWQEIADNHYDSVAEALTYAPGVTVTGGVVNTSQRIVRIDGDERVAVFIDGHRMNLESGLTNGRSTYDLDMAVPTSAIDRIEVIHGAADGGYLNYDTPGGAITIVTRKGSGRQFQLEGARGPYDGWRWNAHLEGSAEGWSWLATGGRSNLDALHYRDSSGDRHTMPDSAQNRREMFYRFDRQFTDSTSLTLSYAHFSNSRGLWLGRSYWDTHRENYEAEKLANNVNLTYNYKEDTAAPGWISLYHNYNQADSYYPAGTEEQDHLPSYSRWKAYTNGLDWRDGWKVGKHFTVTAGITWQHTSLDTEQNLLDARNFAKNYNQGISNLSAYMTTKTRYGKLSLQSTSLFNHNTRFHNEYVYGDSLEYRPDDRLTFYGSLQRIYSVPTLDELYYNNYNRDSDGAWKIRGNEHLQPETGFKWNGGIRYKISSHSTLGVNAFVSHINNPIVWYKEAGTWTPKNLESQNKDGIQVTWEDQFSPKYGLTASYAWTRTDTTYGSGIDPQYTDEAVPHAVKAALTYRDKRWTNSLLFQAAWGRDKSWYTGNAFTLDANVNYKVNQHWSAWLKLRNLLDESYEDVGSRTLGDCPAYGRTALVGVTYAL